MPACLPAWLGAHAMAELRVPSPKPQACFCTLTPTHTPSRTSHSPPPTHLAQTVLSTIGQLAEVSGTQFRPYISEVMPLVIEAIQVRGCGCGCGRGCAHARLGALALGEDDGLAGHSVYISATAGGVEVGEVHGRAGTRSRQAGRGQGGRAR